MKDCKNDNKINEISKDTIEFGMVILNHSFNKVDKNIVLKDIVYVQKTKRFNQLILSMNSSQHCSNVFNIYLTLCIFLLNDRKSICLHFFKIIRVCL